MEYEQFFEYCKGKQKVFAEKIKVFNFNHEFPLLTTGPVLFSVVDFILSSLLDKKIKDQQYHFAVFNLYMEHLAAFLED